jgi:hypothetical protein
MKAGCPGPNAQNPHLGLKSSSEIIISEDFGITQEGL